jgi:acetyl-CoA carboxylase biotin carboxyl carrier protein
MNDEKPRPLRHRIANALTGRISPRVDPDVVRELAKLLEETGLNEIEIERGGARIRVARGAMVSAIAGPAQPSSTQQTIPESRQSEPAAKGGTLVTSPMVGTVFLSPQPGAPPFVQLGDKVTDGTVCIVEAMKTMNPVAAPIAGRIAEIFVRDGQPVEFGEPLMRID